MSKDSIHNSPIEQEDISINIAEIYQAIKSHFILIVAISVIFAALGAVYSLTIPNEYVSNVKLLPEIDAKSSGSNLGGLKSLAGLAGVDIGGGSGVDVVRPEIYPSVLQSTPFLREALKSKVFVQKRKKWMTVFDYIVTSPELPPIQIFSKDKSKRKEEEALTIPKEGLSPELINLSRLELIGITNLRNRISAETDKKNGMVTIIVKLTDPIATAMLINFTQNYLTKYVSSYRTEKARKELKFLQDRHAESRKTYDNALSRLSTYKDQHRNTFLQVAKDQEKKLQYEVDLAFNIYSSISTQMADAAVKIQRETPVFKVLEPAQVALEKSEPKRSLITIGFLFFGVFISLVIVFFRTVNLKQLLDK